MQRVKIDKNIKELIESNNSIEIKIEKSLEGKFPSVEGKMYDIYASLDGKLSNISTSLKLHH